MVTALASEPAVGLPRRGQHRDSALATYRRARAVELRLQGLSYDAIATELGYANKGTVHRIVRQALEVREAEAADLLRSVEYSRLEALHRTLWPKAVSGDLKAAQALLRISEVRCRLLGLYGPSGRTETQHQELSLVQDPPVPPNGGRQF